MIKNCNNLKNMKNKNLKIFIIKKCNKLIIYIKNKINKIFNCKKIQFKQK